MSENTLPKTNNADEDKKKPTDPKLGGNPNHPVSELSEIEIEQVSGGTQPAEDTITVGVGITF